VKTCTRASTAINHSHRTAGAPPPWPSSSALLDKLRAHVPEAFVEEIREESHSARDEREAIVRLLDRIAVQSSRYAKLAGYLRGLLAQGHHLEPASELFAALFSDQEVAGEPRTTCDLCGAAVVRGRVATDPECEAHRCRRPMRARRPRVGGESL
jgi:hypothetical protein